MRAQSRCVLALSAVVGAASAACGGDGGPAAGSPADPTDGSVGTGGTRGSDARAPESGGGPAAGGALHHAGGGGGGSAADTGPEPLDGGGDGPLPTDASLPPISCDGPGARFATSVVGHEFGPGQNVGQDVFPEPVLGPPKGGGACQGSTDVVSLGNGGFVVLAFEGNAITDGPGPDFIVFENAFGSGCDPALPFAELGTVAVSDDGALWHEYPCTATAAPYGACSGVSVVYANADSNTIDPADPAVAGGDAYDLADLGVTRARFVRITDRVDQTGTAGVYDLDAVVIVNAVCP